MIHTTQCAFCKHYRAEPGKTCDAFPTGIPDAIWLGEHDHRSAYPGDHNIHLELRSGYAEELLGEIRAPEPMRKAS